jgi:hypothetical protein
LMLVRVVRRAVLPVENLLSAALLGRCRVVGVSSVVDMSYWTWWVA